MCQIIVKKEGQKFDISKLDKAQGWNEDGYGVTWWENGKLETFMTMNYNRFKAMLSTLKPHKAVAHLRNTTRGITCVENNHPFDIPSGKLFHNGTIYGLDSTQEGGSDTQALADLITECEYGYIEDISPLIQSIIGDTLNKLVFFEADGKITIMNEDLGQWEDGIWYSNDYHLKTTTRAGKGKKEYSYNNGGTNYVFDPKLKKYVPEKKEIPTATVPVVKTTVEKSKLTKVFVYGTLKKGFNNHEYHLGKAKFKGAATTVSKWAMIGENLPFPYLLKRNDVDGLNIVGEVYEVTAAEMVGLNRLEGVPHHYKPTYVYVSYNDGKPSENVMVYVKTIPTVMDMAQPFISEFKKKKLTTVKDY